MIHLLTLLLTHPTYRHTPSTHLSPCNTCISHTFFLHSLPCQNVEVHRDDLIAQLSTTKQASIAAAATALEVHQTEISRLNDSRMQLEECVQHMTSEHEKVRSDHELACSSWKEEVDSLRSQLISLTTSADNPTKTNAEGIREDIMTSMQKDHQTMNGRFEQQLDELMQRNTALIHDNEVLNVKIRDLEEKSARSAEVFQGMICDIPYQCITAFARFTAAENTVS